MADNEQFGVEAVLDLDGWSQNVAQWLRDAGRMEARAESLIDKLNELSDAMSGIESDIDISLSVDSGDLEGIADEIDNLSGEAEVSVSVDAAEFDELESELGDFEGGDFEAEASVTVDGDDDFSLLDADLTAFEGTEATAEADVTTSGEEEIDLLAADLASIEGTEAEANVAVEATEESEETVDLLKQIRAGLVATIILNVAGTILDVLGQIESFTLAPILDVEDSMARFNAQTGESVDGLDELINRLHFGDFGDFDQITATLIAAEQQGIHFGDGMEEAAQGALSITKVFEDQNPVEVLRTMNQLVSQGLVDDFPAAANLIAAGLQNGNNRARDMFQTLDQYGTMFAEMGLSGQQAMSLINSGLDAGFRSASDVARAVDTMNKNITGAEPGSAIDDALGTIGVELPAQGEQVGEDFFNSVIAGIQAHPEQADAAIEAIFGGRADKVSDAFGELTLEDAAFDDLEGRADEAATNIDNSLRGVLDDFVLWAQSTISEILNSAEIDLPGKIDELKTRLQDALAAIQSGEGFGEALEVALQVPGLNDTFQRIESGLGNFEIVLLQVVAALADLIGQTQVAADARQEVTRLAEGQLAFDIKIADDAEGITRAVSTAIDRGVELADVQSAIETAVTELINQGDIEEAQALLDTLEVTPEFTVNAAAADNLTEQMEAELLLNHVELIPTMDPSEIERLVGEGLLIPTSIDTGALQEQVDQARADLAASTTAAPIAPNEIRALTQPLEDVQTASGELSNAYVEDIALISSSTQEATDAVVLNADQIASAVEDADSRINQAVIGGSIVPDIQLIATTTQTALPPIIPIFQNISSEVDVMGNEFEEAMEQVASASSGFDVAIDRARALEMTLQGLGNEIPIIQSLVREMRALASAGTDARQAVQSVSASPTSSQLPAHAEGGVAGPGFFSAAPGEELMFADERMAVLNAETSRSLFSALETLTSNGLGNSSTDNSREVNVYQNIVTNSQAESENAAQRTADSVRGF